MADVHALLDEWLANVTDDVLKSELVALKDAGDENAITDAFFQDLEFGTAGLRGTLGAGTNRMNIYTVGRATQGFAEYLVANFENPTVAIARDSRNNGELFVKTAAAIFAANGVVAKVYPKISPVPTLSWAVRDLKCSGGVCVTASHNPAQYNGYKAYGPMAARSHPRWPMPSPPRSPRWICGMASRRWISTRLWLPARSSGSVTIVSIAITMPCSRSPSATSLKSRRPKRPSSSYTPRSMVPASSR